MILAFGRAFGVSDGVLLLLLGSDATLPKTGEIRCYSQLLSPCWVGGRSFEELPERRGLQCLLSRRERARQGSLARIILLCKSTEIISLIMQDSGTLVVSVTLSALIQLIRYSYCIFVDAFFSTCSFFIRSSCQVSDEIHSQLISWCCYPIPNWVGRVSGSPRYLNLVKPKKGLGSLAPPSV